ncbi:MAG TPA: hypothetical protein VM901_12255 [Bdellovibrionota bacterium]|jgi:hypothetical protein|nr:hypothetical protein [Bdellovibrionota bacterium]
MDNFFSTLFASIVTLTPGTLPNPKIATLTYDSPQTHCFARELRRQAPENLLAASGDIYVMGPSERRDVVPAGSVIELFGTAPNGKPKPTYLSLSVWFETPDGAAWKRRTRDDGALEYSADAVMNPAKVFDRVQYRYLFDFDLSECLKLSK